MNTPIKFPFSFIKQLSFSDSKPQKGEEDNKLILLAADRD